MTGDDTKLSEPRPQAESSSPVDAATNWADLRAEAAKRGISLSELQQLQRQQKLRRQLKVKQQ